MAHGSPESELKGALPRWSLRVIYEDFDSKKYRDDISRLQRGITHFSELADDPDARAADPASWLKEAVTLLNDVSDLSENLEAFAYASYSVNTVESRPMKELNQLQQLTLPLHKARVTFRNALRELEGRLPKLLEADPELAGYRYFFEEELYFQQHQMTAEMEDLAADLSRAGADAWSRLQETVSSTLSVAWNENGDQRKTVVELRGLAYNEDPAVREKAFRKELEAWRSVETPLAYSLNGVKGYSAIIDSRQGYRDSLERAARQSRVSPTALHALLSVMEDSLPVFRRYLGAKARLLGKKQLAFFDLFAPVGNVVRKWTFRQAQDFIAAQFRSFSAELADFATRAFGNSWIDAEPRSGKIGGAYCISMPLAGESRVLANFDGSFSSVMTLAHELGHAYHHEVLRDAPALYRDYPMTLAETASIFSETVVHNRALELAREEEKLSMLEIFLQDATQVIVDILSRFKFERAMFERRPEGELTAAELCELMLVAQEETYGGGIDPEERHPYMWAVKGHYYRHEVPFYNYPYAFGQLFGLGLFALYSREPDGFAERYRTILSMTGIASAVDVAASAGFDIQTTEFWQSGIDLIAERVESFTSLAGAT